MMNTLLLGSLNINGGRDAYKREIVKQMHLQKRLDVLFLQETHSDALNEIDWKMWWGGTSFLSHGTNVSGGVAILFSPTVGVCVKSTVEVVAGRALVVRAQIQDISFVFINVYSPTSGPDRLLFFKEISQFLEHCDPTDCIVVGGDWNCTLKPGVDRTGKEPHLAYRWH